MEFLADPEIWIAFGTLLVLEIVLGIDNVVFSEVRVCDWGRFVFFSDPDGNGWAVQEVPAR